MNKTPAVRFKGFSDEWEQRKLGNLGTLKNGMNFSKDAMGIGFPFVNLQDIFGKSIIDADNLGKAMATPEQLRDYNLISGDVLFVRSSVKLEGVGETALVAVSLKNTTYSGFIIRFRDETGLDSNFKRFVFATKNVRKQILSQATDSANKNISQTVLSNLELYYPAINEQKAIGVFFSYIDNLITRYQCKYEKLKNIKKSMLYKMFPQNGSKVPEIRFKGFTDDWEKRKVGEITSVLSASRVHKYEWKTDGVPFYRSSDVISAFKGNDNEKAFISAELYEELIKSSGRLEQGDILITGGGSIGIPYIVPNNAPLYSKDADLIWIKKSALHDSRYLYTYFTSQSFIDYIGSISHIGTIAHYTIEQVKDTPVLLPEMAEQIVLGDFFGRIDNLITLHQRKLEKLKQLKQAMLHKMFV